MCIGRASISHQPQERHKTADCSKMHLRLNGSSVIAQLSERPQLGADLSGGDPANLQAEQHRATARAIRLNRICYWR